MQKTEAAQEDVEIKDYIFQSIEKIGEHKYFNSMMVDYKIALASGEIVRFSRSKTLLAPYFGEIVQGFLSTNDQGIVWLVSMKNKKDKTDEKLDIRGTQLFIAYMEVKRIQPDMAAQEFIDQFRDFQQML